MFVTIRQAAPAIWLGAIIGMLFVLYRSDDPNLERSQRPERSPTAPEERQRIGSRSEAAGIQPVGSARKLRLRVCDAETGEKVLGARVFSRGPMRASQFLLGTTDDDGYIWLREEDCEIGAFASGYVPRWIEFPLGRRRFAVTISPGTRLRGRVVRYGTGDSVEEAKVSITDVDSSELLAVLSTDREGRFEIGAVRAGHPFLVEVESPGFAPTGRTEPPGYAGEEIVIELGGGASIHGRVVDSSGEPAVDAKVTVKLAGGGTIVPGQAMSRSYSVHANTGPDGGFHVQGVRAPGAYDVSAVGQDLAIGVAHNVHVGQVGAAVSRRITLRSRTTLLVEVNFPEGEFQPNCTISLRRGGETVGLAGSRFYELDEAGDYEVRANAPNWPSQSLPITVLAGRRNEVIVNMTRADAPGLRGHVTCQQGALTGALVRFSTHDMVRSTVTGRDGGFFLFNVPGGSGVLTVEDKRGVYESWSRAGIRATRSEPIEIRLRPAARFVGRVEPSVVSHVMIHYKRPHALHLGAEAVGIERVEVDPGGRIEVPWAPKTKAVFALETGRYVPVFFNETALAHGETRDLGVVRLAARSAADGVVVDVNDVHIQGARLQLHADGLFRDFITYTGSAGRFRYDLLPDAPARIDVTAAGFVPVTLTYERATDVQGARIRLEPAGHLSGSLVDTTMNPIAGASLEGIPVGAGRRFTTETDSVGRFSVFTAPGRYRLSHQGDRGGPLVTVEPSRETTVEYRAQG